MHNRHLIVSVAAAVLFLVCSVSYPITTTLNPADDADGEFTAGSWSLFAPQDNILMVKKPPPPPVDENEYRAAMEYEISALPAGAVPSSATLRLWATDPNQTIGVYGYAGDGIVTGADLAVDDFIVSFDHSPGLNEVDVTGFLQSLVSAGESYAGFALREETTNHFAQFWSVESGSPPELVIDLIPEPGSWSLLALGALACMNRRR